MRLITGGPAAVLVGAVLVSTGAAGAAEARRASLGCPTPQRVAFSSGAYAAAEATPGWSGQWRSASADQGRVVRFESALVHRNPSTDEHKFVACTYETDRGQFLDLTYFSSSAPGRLGNLVVTLAEPAHWQAEAGDFLECAGSGTQCRVLPMRFEMLRTR